MRKHSQPIPADNAFILLVDDDPISLLVMEKILQNHYTVCSVTSAEEAIEILNVRAPALVILDVMMPELSGIDVCKMIKTTDRLSAVPVIFLSACDKPLDFEKGYEAGGVMYLAKPIRSPQLLLMARLYASRIFKKETA